MRTSEIDMAESVDQADIDTFIDNAASPGAAIFRRDMLFDVPFIADWKKILEYRQRQTDRSNKPENKTCVNFDSIVGVKVLIRKDGILRKAESRWINEPWT